MSLWKLNLLGSYDITDLLCQVNLEKVQTYGEPSNTTMSGKVEYGLHSARGEGIVIEPGVVCVVLLVRDETAIWSRNWTNSGLEHYPSHLYKGDAFRIYEYSCPKEWFAKSFFEDQLVIPANTLQAGTVSKISKTQHDYIYYDGKCYYCGHAKCYCPKTWHPA